MVHHDLQSDDPTEIAVYYYIDGIPMSAVDDLKGRCLKAFLKRRQQWNRQQASLNGNVPVSSLGSFNQRVGVPVYSGRDTERRVKETCVIQRLYEVRGKEVGNFKIEDIPELECEQIVAPNKQEEHVRWVATGRELMNEQAFAEAWAKGRAMTLEQAIADALGECDDA